MGAGIYQLYRESPGVISARRQERAKKRQVQDMEFTSNYDKQCEEWRQKFLTMDQEEICQRLPELQAHGGDLTLWHFGRQFAIDRQTGEIRALSDERPVEAMAKMNIYTLFQYAKKGAANTGEWLPYRELKSASPFAAAFRRGILEPIAATFSGQGDALAEAVKSLRGQQLSDTGFLLWAFLCMPVKLNFWDVDEEFPAQANMLFDRNSTDFNHVESVATIATECMHQLADAAGLKLKGSPFIRF